MPLRLMTVGLGLMVLTLVSSTAAALGLPVMELHGAWTPTYAEGVQITSVRVTVTPAADQGGRVVWTVDETMVMRNQSEGPLSIVIAIPNAWSQDTSVISREVEPFWGRAYINGTEVDTELVELVVNPAYASVTYRGGRVFDVSFDTAERVYVRLQYALPVLEEEGERGLVYPFGLRTLWDGPIDAGVIDMLWTDRMYGFRSNLGGYALYPDRAEWFVWAFEPTSDLEARFATRQMVFQLVAREIGCPMPWEVLDRISDADMEALEATFAHYTVDQLEICSHLPGALRGSMHDATASGLRSLTLEQFAPYGSTLSGPLVIVDPNYSADDLTDAEAIYVRFLTQAVSQME